MKFSMIIPAHNEEALIQKCFDAVDTSGRPSISVGDEQIELGRLFS